MSLHELYSLCIVQIKITMPLAWSQTPAVSSWAFSVFYCLYLITKSTFTVRAKVIFHTPTNSSVALLISFFLLIFKSTSRLLAIGLLLCCRYKNSANLIFCLSSCICILQNMMYCNSFWVSQVSVLWPLPLTYTVTQLLRVKDQFTQMTSFFFISFHFWWCCLSSFYVHNANFYVNNVHMQGQLKKLWFAHPVRFYPLTL